MSLLLFSALAARTGASPVYIFPQCDILPLITDCAVRAGGAAAHESPQYNNIPR